MERAGTAVREELAELLSLARPCSGDRRTFYIRIDQAPNMTGLTRCNFYKRYLVSSRLRLLRAR
jgi:hypothetical protein